MAWNEPGHGQDPWNQGSGGKPGGQPPDLEKLLKRLRSRFGRGRGGRPASGGLLGLVIVALIVLWLVSGFYTVNAQQQGVVLRFGAISGVSGPGLGWHLPWPVGRVLMVNTTKLRQITTQSTLLTRDHNLVDVGLTVQFRVSSAKAYLFNVEDPDDTLQQAAKSVLRGVVATYTVNDVLTGSQQEIASKVKQKLQKVLDDYGCGLYITDASLTQVQPPEPVQKAFADAIQASDDNQQMKASAQSYAHNRLPQAQSQASQLISSAQDYRESAVSKAQGDVARFNALLKEYRKAPQLTRQRMYIDTIGSILQHTRTVLVDSGKHGSSINITLGPGLAPSSLPASSGSTAAPGSNAGAASAGGPPASGGQGSSGDNSSRSRNRGGNR